MITKAELGRRGGEQGKRKQMDGQVHRAGRRSATSVEVEGLALLEPIKDAVEVAGAHKDPNEAQRTQVGRA